jgi:hypothetical protein
LRVWRAMNAQICVASALIKIKRTCTQRIGWTAGHTTRVFGIDVGFAAYHRFGRGPARPFAGVGHAEGAADVPLFFADPDGVADCLSFFQYPVQCELTPGANLLRIGTILA